MTDAPYFSLQQLGGLMDSDEFKALRANILPLLPENRTLRIEGKHYKTLIVTLPDIRHGEMVHLLRRIARFKGTGAHLYKVLPPEEPVVKVPPRFVAQLGEHNRAALDLPLWEIVTNRKRLAFFEKSIWRIQNPDSYARTRYRQFDHNRTYYVGELAALPWETVEGFDRMGPYRMAQLEQRLSQLGVTLGMQLEGQWAVPVIAAASMEVLSTRLDAMGLLPRTLNALTKDGRGEPTGTLFLGDIVDRDDQSMLRRGRFGKESLADLKSKLPDGMVLGVQPSDWWEFRKEHLE